MRNKYNNKKTVINGITFHSQKEGLRYIELKQMEKNKKILNLILQPKFKIVVNGMKVCSYIADFSYIKRNAKGKEDYPETIIEDVKGFKTSIYRLKKKLMKAALGIEIQEI